MDVMTNRTRLENSGGGYSFDDPYYDLAAAIVLMAVKDCIKAFRKMWKKNTSIKVKREAILEKAEIEDFFHSDWYYEICGIDPDKVLAECRRKAERQEKEAIRKRNRKKVKELLKKSDGETKGGRNK